MDAIVRLDTLAKERGMSRDEMMGMLVDVWEDRNDEVGGLLIAQDRLSRENAALFAELVEAQATIAMQRKELSRFRKDGLIARLRGLLRG